MNILQNLKDQNVEEIHSYRMGINFLSELWLYQPQKTYKSLGSLPKRPTTRTMWNREKQDTNQHGPRQLSGHGSADNHLEVGSRQVDGET